MISCALLVCFPRLSPVTCSRARWQEHVFPRFSPVTCYRAQWRGHVFPHFSSVTCFPALFTCFKFLPLSESAWLLALSPVVYFPRFTQGANFVVLNYLILKAYTNRIGKISCVTFDVLTWPQAQKENSGFPPNSLKGVEQI